MDCIKPTTPPANTPQPRTPASRWPPTHPPTARSASDSLPLAMATPTTPAPSEQPTATQLSASLPEPLPVSSMNHPKRSLILSRKLQQIFQLPPDEELLAEYPAWLFRSLLLKGYLYLTSAHLCFYAFLRSNEREADDDPESALKAGILTRHHSRSKLDQRQASKKSWFILKNTILSWYPSSHELFFPTGQIDLHFCTKLEQPNPNSKNPNQFKLFVSGKVYTFSSDTQQSRDDWLKLLQQTIFACQHDGQNVKIAIPLSAIENIQKCDSIQFAQTVCIKIKENAPAIPFAPNSQAIQEEIGDSSLVDYFFGFLQDSQTPYEQLKAALDPIRDSTRFRLPSTPLPKPGEDYFASSAPTPLSRSGSQLMASSPSDYYSEERKTKFTDKITKIASTSIKFVGSPIRPATNNTVKNVPVTLNPIKPAKDVINSAKGLMASAQDASASTSATKKDPPTQSQSVDKLSDEEGTGEAQLTQRDQFKFQSEFNFLTPGVVSSNSANPEGLIRLLLKTKCNLVRSGSSMYGQVYLASPVPPAPSSKQKTARKSCVCFKGQKVMSIAPIKMILPIEALTAVRSDALKLFLTTQPTDALVGQEEVCFEFANPEQIKAVHDEILRMVESSSSSFLTFKPQSKLHITCLTIGSRGDVQPYIALCQKLQRDGHTCRIASHGEYRTWVEGYGIEYVEIGGDPAELMKICVDNGMFTLGFLKEAFSKFRGWLDELLVSSFDACQGTDLLIESPSTMAGIHIAEALQIPYFRAFTMPWTRTKEYPHAFAVPDRKMGSGYNYMTYTVFDQVFWKAMSGQVNKWRKEKLGLRSTTYEKLEVHKVPFLYNFSPSIVPAPLDWYEWIHVTGYWFIDEHDPNKLSQQQPPPVQVDSPTSEPTITQSSSQKSSWDAPPDLLAFLDRAHSQNKKVVYIGFGSIVVPDPEATTKVIIESVKTAGVYAIVSKGWSERLSSGTAGKKGKRANTSEEEGMAEEEDLSMVYQIAAIPHDWLFPRIDAVCHHGGSGTTGASLRAGIPTIIKPFFGDQFFWAERVESLGIGAGLRKLSVKTLASALTLATSDPTQISRARIVGQLIRNEDGAGKAVECIYRDLDYARSLIKPRPAPQAPQPQPHTISRPSPKGQTGSPHAARASGEGTSEGSEANASSLLLMSAHSSGSDDPDRQPDTLPASGSSSGAAFFDCAHPPSSALTLVPHHPTPSTSPAADGPSEDTTARPEAGPHALLGQRSDTTIGPTADPVPGTRRPPAAKGKQKALPADDEDVERAGEVSTTKSSAPTPPDEHRSSASDASEASWDILSQQSKPDPDPAAAADLSASFDQF
ncbi:hypothetical protein PtA15_1A906 [Puccinia triticina]|uniref:sterol 3beta-glucosyltransferase n=1 Tax=Puccinia triticina TaxID=208348 RepID=A0ABY7CA57_9BASI|nr:uncharacterized protein PtA15_1A906 [Puccinia triticina]WAQ81564.1 hypothetical protein PtA15_1A906 [Puccinia triticina]